MKIIMLSLAALVLGTTLAAASCPSGTAYNCTSSWNGKQSCGCR